MIIHRCPQRSEEWFRLRLGIPTASNFGRILTAKTMKLSTTLFGQTFSFPSVKEVLARASEGLSRCIADPSHLLDGHADDFAVLFHRHGGRFAGGADHADAVGAFGDVPVDQGAQGGVVHAAVCVQGRDQGDDAAKDGCHGDSFNAGHSKGRARLS